MTNPRIENAMAIEGMTGREALALMDIFVRRAVEKTGGSRFAEFGAYKGRTACLLAQNTESNGWVDIVESADYLQLEHIQRHSNRITWHRERSETFTAERLPTVLGNSRLTATHHDASHFFSNVHTELKNVEPLMEQGAVIILDDFNDIYAQVRAAFYRLRYTSAFPFEILLIGFNKCFLVHSAHFLEQEAFVLDRLLDEAEAGYELPLRLARTDNNPLSRGFCVTRRNEPGGERHHVMTDHPGTPALQPRAILGSRHEKRWKLAAMTFSAATNSGINPMFGNLDVLRRNIEYLPRFDDFTRRQRLAAYVAVLGSRVIHDMIRHIDFLERLASVPLLTAAGTTRRLAQRFRCWGRTLHPIRRRRLARVPAVQRQSPFQFRYLRRQLGNLRSQRLNQVPHFHVLGMQTTDQTVFFSVIQFRQVGQRVRLVHDRAYRQILFVTLPRRSIEQNTITRVLHINHGLSSYGLTTNSTDGLPNNPTAME